MPILHRRQIIFGLPALILGVKPTPADAFIQGLLIRGAGRAVASFFARTGTRRAASTIARSSARRGLHRMESSGFKRHKDEFIGGVVHGTGSAIGEAVTTQVISAIRPNKQNGIVYCAAIGTDCNGSSACRGLQRAYPPRGDKYVTGGFKDIDKQIVLVEEANAIGLDWVAAKKANQGWKNADIASAYFPVGFVSRDVGRTGKIREQSLKFLTPTGTVTTEERIDYSSGAGHVSLSAYANGSTFNDYFSFSV